MAGIISQAGDKRVIMDYGIFHAHGPQVPKGQKVEASLVGKMLESLKTMIGAKANLSEDEIADIMGKESVFTAVEALEMGFFDEIEKTKGNSPTLATTSNVEALFEIANKFITNNTEKMQKLNSLLSLENASEDVIVNAVTAIQAEAAKVEELTNSIAELTTESVGKDEKIEALTNEIKVAKALNAETIVNAAITEGKIAKESKSVWIGQATNDLEGTVKLIEGLTVAKGAAKITDKIKADGSSDDSRENWTFRDFSEKAPEALEEMQNSAPEKFEKLYQEYIK